MRMSMPSGHSGVAGSAALGRCNHVISKAAVASLRTAQLMSYVLGGDKANVLNILRGGIFGHGPGGNVRQAT